MVVAEVNGLPGGTSIEAMSGPHPTDLSVETAEGDPGVQASLERTRKRTRHAFAALLFLVFAVVELWTPIVHGGYYLPADIGQLFSLTHVHGQPSTPKNAVLSDVYVAFGPILHYDVAQVSQGHLPTWNANNGNGQPYFADNQTVVVSPFTFPFYFLSFRIALIVAALARLWMLGFFTYLFLARHKLKFGAAAIGGALFAYAGYHLVWLDYQTQVSVSACLPLGLWCVRVAFDNRRVIGTARRSISAGNGRTRAKQLAALVGLSVVLGIMVYGGHPETDIFDTLLIVGYAAVVLAVECHDWRTRAAWVARLGGVAALGVGIAAFQILPFLQYSGEGTRPAHLRSDPAASVAGFLPDTAPLMAFPDLFGGAQFAYSDHAFYARHQPQTNYAEVGGNAVGLLALCLTPLGLFAAWKRRRQPIAWFGTLAGLVGTVFLYTRFAGLWWHDLPVVGAAGLNRSQDMQVFGIAVLGALGVDWLLSVAGSRVVRRKAAVVVGGVFVLVGFIELLFAQGLRRLVHAMHGSKTDVASAMRLVQHNVLIEILIAGAFALALMAYLLVKHHAVRAIGVLALIVLAFASNGLTMTSYNPTVSKRLFYPRTAALKKVIKQVGSGETLFAAGSFPFAPTNLWFGLDNIGSYDAIGLRWHDALYDKVFKVSSPKNEQMPACVNSLQLFGVQWVVGGSGLWNGASTPGLVAVHAKDKVPVYPVPSSYFATVVGQTLTAADGDRKAQSMVSRCSFNPNTTAVLDTSPYSPKKDGHLGRLHGMNGVGGFTKIERHASSRVVIKTFERTGDWLVIRQSYAPGWTAAVDGRPAPVVRADIAFDAVHVPKGLHVVTLTYAPSSISDGAVISIISVVVSAGLLVTAGYWWWRPRRERPEEQPAAVE